MGNIMKPFPSMQALITAMAVLVLLSILFSLLLLFWLFPLRMKLRLKRCGFDGPPPMFPLGNLKEMKKKGKGTSPPCPAATLTLDIHSQVFPYFALWRKTYGKIFVYWLGTEPFLYVADPEFLKQVSSGALCKKWGKPNVFRHDRKPMFGNGLVMVEGDEWADRRHVIAQAFSMTNLNGMISIIVETTSKMLDNWNHHLSTDGHEIDVEREITGNAAEIIAKTSFGISDQNGKLVFDKLQALQTKLFRPNRLVGVPFNNLLYPKHAYDVRKLGEEIDQLLLSIIESRMTKGGGPEGGGPEGTVHRDLLAILLDSNKFTSRELVDECKTFFFGGLETTALALTWALFLLATYPEWQEMLRKEVMEVTGGQPLDSTMLSKLTKMEMVLNESLRLYSPAPNAQRQAREDIRAADVVIPKGTNMWVDVVGMHRDAALWGDDVHEFRPDRFEGSLCGGCRHRMGFLPFGFGARACVGRSLTSMEYKVVLSLILRRYSMSVSPAYSHSPTVMLTLKPSHGMPLVFRRIDDGSS